MINCRKERRRRGVAGGALWLAAFALPAAILAQTQPVSVQISTGEQPMAVAVNEATHRAYVVNHNHNTVTVIDGKTRTALAVIKTGSGPEGIAVNPATNRIYVANAGDSSVTVIDGATNTVVGTARGGAYCQALAVNSATNKIYAANNSGHSVTVIDGASNAAGTVRAGQGPRAIVANPATNTIYAVNYSSDDVTVIDGATNTAKSIVTGERPWALALDARANRLFVAHVVGSTVAILDGATGARRDVAVGETPFAVAVNSNTGVAYVLSYSAKTLTMIDGASGKVTKAVPLATHPSAIAVNPATNQVYVANQATASVAVIDGATGATTATVKAGTIPYAMAVDTAANQVYVANFGSDDVTVIHFPGSAAAPKFRVVALAERASGDHQSFVDAARRYLDKLGADNGFAVDYIDNTESLDRKSLAAYRLFVQLNYPPYRWAAAAKEAFQDYITQGKGGWIGFHHAALLGEFDGFPMDPWFSQFLGGIRYSNYLPDFATATVKMEDASSPLAKGVSPSFVVEKEEWYTWNRSPRPNVKVLATVDEASYVPDSKIKMGGDHPVVWSNPDVKARNVYIFMGHHARLFENPDFAQLFRNAIFWGAGQ